MRTSHIAYVVIRLRVGERDRFLLQYHRKWGDWSLVGGHVEPFEHGDFLAAARREVEEELVPLRFGTDFTLERIAGAPERWGPIPSRSAGGAPTTYVAAWFALIFVRDAGACLRRLGPAELDLVDRESVLAPTHARDALTSLLRRLHDAVPGGLEAVPLAWSRSLAERDVPREFLRGAMRAGASSPSSGSSRPGG